jgi:hypothetical protein
LPEKHVRFALMFKKPLTLAVVGVALSLTLGNARAAGPASFEGIVTDANGKTMKGAEVRVETKDGVVISKSTTDGNGHYVSGKIPAGTYKVDLLVKSVTKASLTNQKASGSGNATKLNFALTSAMMAAQNPAKKGKHMVWVPPQTGTHIGGRWVEVDDEGTASMQHVDKADGRLLEKMQDRGPGSGGGTP